MPSQSTITIQTLTAGQPRPYADSVYKYKVSAVLYWQNAKGELVEGVAGTNPETALFLAKQAYGQEVKDIGEQREWHSAYVQDVVPEGQELEGRAEAWVVTIIDPFKD